ncbi:MAG: NusG domain II-containing protein [Clostridia bacterium]
MRIGDKIVVVLIVISLIGVAFYWFNGSNDDLKYVEVWQDGELYGIYELNDEDNEILIEAHDMFNLIVIEEGSVYMKDANCPTQQCIAQGEINRDNQSIVCLPHKIVVKVVDENNSEVDFIVK